MPPTGITLLTGQLGSKFFTIPDNSPQASGFSLTMRSAPLIALLFLFLCATAHGQETVVYFSWNNSVTTPEIGPVATTTSPYATLSSDGRDGTNGLSAGLAPGGDPTIAADRADINLTVPYTPDLDVDGIDISIDFQRDEDDGSLVTRGSSFVFGSAEGAYVYYELLDPEEGAVSGFSSALLAVDPDDDVWHRLRFTYDQFTGEAKLYLDGALVWEPGFTTPDQVLYWDSGADLVIGDGIDGGGLEKAVLDNFYYGAVVEAATFPVTLTDFTATPTGDAVHLDWATASETDNYAFHLERSADAVAFQRLASQPATGAADDYRYTDRSPLPGRSYYRLVQEDLDGTLHQLGVRSVDRTYPAAAISVYPNPTADYLFVSAMGPLTIFDAAGRNLTARVPVSAAHGTERRLDLRGLPRGTYVLRTGHTARKVFRR